MTRERAGGTTLFLLFARSEWRRRWRSHLMLAVVAAVTVASAVAVLTGASRSESAFRRLRSETRASDVVYSSDDIAADPYGALAKVLALDGVEAATVEAQLFVRPAGSGLFPDYNLFAFAPLEPPGDDGLNVPVVTKGRAVDPSRADEVALSENLVKTLGLTVGDTLTLESMTAEWVDTAFNGGDPGPPDGPKITTRVVGVARSPADFGRGEGLVHLSPAFVARYGDQLNVYTFIHARLSSDALQRSRTIAFETIEGFGGPSIYADDAATDDGLDTIATALRLLAAVLAVAGWVTLGLGLVRLARVALIDRYTLVALGWTRRQMAGVTTATFAPWVIGGIAVGVILGAVASPLALVGLARKVDPAPTAVRVDGVILFTVSIAAVMGAVVTLLAVGLRAASSREPRRARRHWGPPLGRPIAVVVGVRNALFGEANGGGRASRGAVAVMAAGSAAAVAALMVSASIGRLQSDPSLSGQSSARVVDSGESVDVYDQALPLLEQDPRVATVAGVHVSFDLTAGRDAGLTSLIYDIRRGDIGASVLDGRIAQQPDEVALGPATLDRLGRTVDDRIELRGPNGNGEYRIVGSILFPEGDFPHDDGAALTIAGADRVLGNTHDTAQIHQIAYAWADGVDADAADAQLRSDGFSILTNETALKPASVTNLAEVEALPRFLAAFIVVLSLVTLGHALSASARLRTKEVGALRALGVTRTGCAVVVVAHAAAILTVGVVVGLPLGLALGRETWAPIAHNANVVVRAVAPWTATGVLLVAGVAAAALCTVGPIWRVLRAQPATSLRTE